MPGEAAPGRPARAVHGIALRGKLAAACRVLAAAGHEDFTLGHASAREPGAPRFLLKRSRIGLGETTARDLLLLDLDGHRIEGEGAVPLELPLHAEIFRARPDVNAVVHTHVFQAAAFAAADAEFRMVSQDSVLFADGPRRYDSARLIATPELGRALAAALGPGRLVILRNHGIAAAGATIEEATYLAIAFERSLRLQVAAAAFGPVREIPPDELGHMRRTFDALLEERAQAMFEFLLRQIAKQDGHAR